MCSTRTLSYISFLYDFYVHNKNIIGPRIKSARKNSHFSQMELAAQLQILGLNIDRSMIAKIEIGRRPVSDIEIAGIAKILNVEIIYLFEDSKDWFTRER
jgi:transcriptional regulator with XRE-family HTH domain